MAERRFSSLRDGAEEPPTGTHPEDEMTLEELREQIDVLDRQLVELLSERARAAQRIGHLKAATSLPVYEPGREKVIFANVRAANKGPLPDIELTHIYERIIDVMRSLQKNELASERNARAAAPGQAAGAGSSPETPETGKAQ
jgi:chorismate mutase